MEKVLRRWPLWVLQHSEKEETNFDLPAWYMLDPIRITGPIDKARMQQAVDTVIASNDLFKLRLLSEDDLYIAEVETHPYEMYYEDLTEKGDEEEREKAAHGILKRFCTEGPPYGLPFGFILFKLDEEDYIMTFIIDHILCDGVGSGIILEELGLAYNNEPIPEKTIDFIGYLEELASPEFRKSREKMIEYCADMKEGFEEFIHWNKDIGASGEIIGDAIMFLDSDVLSEVAKKLKSSVFSVCMYLYHAAVSAAFDVSDSMTSFTIGEREMKYRRMVGMMVEPILSRQVFDDARGIQEQFKDFRKTFYQNMQWARPGLDLLALPSFMMTSMNIFTNSEPIMFGDAEGEWYMWTDSSQSNLDMFIIMLLEQEDTVGVIATYDADIFPRETVEKFSAAFAEALELLQEEQDTPFGQLRH